MNKILVEVSIGELLDKISILEIKQEKIKEPEKLKFINNEHSILEDQFKKSVKSCLLYTSPSPRDPKTSRMPSSA